MCKKSPNSTTQRINPKNTAPSPIHGQKISNNLNIQPLPTLNKIWDINVVITPFRTHNRKKWIHWALHYLQTKHVQPFGSTHPVQTPQISQPPYKPWRRILIHSVQPYHPKTQIKYNDRGVHDLQVCPENVLLSAHSGNWRNWGIPIRAKLHL